MSNSSGQSNGINIWSQMSYAPPRGPCSQKLTLMTSCPCFRFMVHPLKAATSYDCDGCGHHASFHRMESKDDEEATRRWRAEQLREREQEEEKEKKWQQQIQHLQHGRQQEKRLLLLEEADEEDEEEADDLVVRGGEEDGVLRMNGRAALDTDDTGSDAARIGNKRRRVPSRSTAVVDLEESDVGGSTAPGGKRRKGRGQR